MIDSSIINLITNTALIGVNMFFCKKWIDRLDIDKKEQNERIEKNDAKAMSAAKEACEKVKALQTAHHGCRETLSERFADREETGHSMAEIFNDLKVLNRKVYASVGERSGDK